MRLININTYEVEEFPDDDKRPPYAILSHVWCEDEVTLQDMQSKTANRKAGFAKIKMMCELTGKEEGHLTHCWADTCCIDKTSSAELSEAINSMYRWYTESKICYAFLYDFDVKVDAHLKRSRWFTRGWTLQELIAPPSTRFYDCNWEIIGPRDDLVEQLIQATGMPRCVLSQDLKPQEYSVAQRLSWAANRVTTRKEDMAYCLMGLLDVNMPLLYGEGGEKAFRRLQEEIIKHSDDFSIFGWASSSQFSYSREDSSWGSVGRSLFAPSVSCFANCGSMRANQPELTDDTQIEEFHVTNRGVSISFLMSMRTASTCVAMLNCSAVHLHGDKSARCKVGILLHRLRGTRDQYARVSMNREDIIYECNSGSVLNDPAELHQRRVLVPLRSTLLFRDWCINVNQLRGNSTRWKQVPGRPTQPHQLRFAQHDRDNHDPTPGRDFYGHTELGRMVYIPDSVISAVRFGLDSNYNPVVFLFAAARHPYAYTTSQRFPWNDEEIDKSTTHPEVKWHHHGYFAVRGHWEKGLRIELHFLNIYLKISGRRLWNIDFSTLSDHR